jgi:hypothetical protein
MSSDLEKLISPDKYQVFLMASPATFPLTFAQHPWFVVNKKGVISRYEVAWRPGRYGEKLWWGHITFNILPPFTGLRVFLTPRKFYSKGRLLKMIEGDESSTAAKMVEFVERSRETYPFKNIYRFRGPNSNTYVQWVLDNFPEAGMKLSWNAFGKKPRDLGKK